MNNQQNHVNHNNHTDASHYYAEMDNAAFGTGYGARLGSAGMSSAGMRNNDMMGNLFGTSQSPWGALKSIFMDSMSQGNMHVDQVQAEVSADQRALIGLISRDGTVCHQLLNRLYNHPPMAEEKSAAEESRAESEGATPFDQEAPDELYSYEGLFLLLTLPEATKQEHPDHISQRSERSELYQEEIYPSHIGSYGTNGWYDAAPHQLTHQHLLALVQEVDCMAYLIRASEGWQSADTRWFSRLRAVGKPMIPVVIDDRTEGTSPHKTIHGQPTALPHRGLQIDGSLRKLSDAIYLQAAVRPIFIHEASLSVTDDPYTLQADLLTLMARILELRPRLAVPLAQNIPGCRRQTVQRIIRSGVIMTSTLGLEPIPLIDLPLHVALNWKVALQIGAIYGRPSLDLRSREMMGTIGLSLALRLLAQQGVKLLPIVGWLLSAGISGASTWLLGQALVRYYEDDLHLNPQEAKAFARHAGEVAKSQLKNVRVGGWAKHKTSAQ